MKFRITITQTREFETTLEDYPEGTTEEEAERIEREAANDDCNLFIDHPDTETKIDLVRVIP